MGDRGDLTAKPVDTRSVITAELVDALTNVVSALGLHGLSGSSFDEPDRLLATT